MAFKPTSEDLPVPFPTIKCLPRKIMNHTDGMKFWCPFCKAWHHHGRGNGHRVAHCVIGRNNWDKETSPFVKTGYNLKIMSKRELREIRKEIDAYLASSIGGN